VIVKPNRTPPSRAAVALGAGRGGGQTAAGATAESIRAQPKRIASIFTPWFHFFSRTILSQPCRKVPPAPCWRHGEKELRVDPNSKPPPIAAALKDWATRTSRSRNSRIEASLSTLSDRRPRRVRPSTIPSAPEALELISSWIASGTQ